jgi:dihydroorotase
MHEGEISTRLGLMGWPRAAEDVIVARDLVLAEAAGSRYHVAHVSSLGAVRLLREAKSRGLQVTAEVTPHHLMLTDHALLGYDTACKVNPPLREAEDREALRQALRDGTIDCIATDHAPHSGLEKDCEFEAAAPGMIGLEPALAVLLSLVRDGLLTPLRLVESLSTAPARIAHLDVGTLREGSLADVALIDPDVDWTLDVASLCSRSSNTPFLDRKMRGRAVMTVVGGKIVYER